MTARVARAAFPKGCLTIRVRDELGALFTDEQFAAAFGVRGRPGLSPGQLALVTVLQFAENLSDRQAADQVRGRIDWKYALGLELDDPGFDHTVLRSSTNPIIADQRALSLCPHRPRTSPIHGFRLSNWTGKHLTCENAICGVQ
jgi:transposase